MAILAIQLREANAFVELHHRHHSRIQGHRFSLGCEDGDGQLHGVAIVGRPVGGQHQDDWLEVTRLCTDGTANACSLLYGAVVRAGQALGYRKVQTYVLQEESGTSLKAAGWTFERLSHPVGWHHGPADGLDGPRAARKVAAHLGERKQLWSRTVESRLTRPTPADVG